MTTIERTSRWVRVEDEHSRWELPGERDSTGILTSAGHLVTDEVIRTYGRKHVEREILAGLPPLPEDAWRVEGGRQQ